MSSSKKKGTLSKSTSGTNKLAPINEASTTTKSKSSVKQENANTVKHESDWYIPPTDGIPKYSAENDKYCPRGQMKKFNTMQKQAAEVRAEKGKSASDWIKSTLKSKFVDVPLTVNMNFTQKAVAKAQHTPSSHMEIEIIQKIVVRENVLMDLRKLVENNSTDVYACMGEVVDLIKGLRWQTVEIVEDIRHYREASVSTLPFLYRGLNYLLKIATDLDFLDAYDEVVEKYCFEFKFNPFAHKQHVSEQIIAGPMTTLSTIIPRKPPPPLTSFFNSKINIDGIELFRVKCCEKDIQDEFDRVDNNMVSQQSTAQGPNFLHCTSLASASSVVSGMSHDPYNYQQQPAAAATEQQQQEQTLEMSKSMNNIVTSTATHTHIDVSNGYGSSQRKLTTHQSATALESTTTRGSPVGFETTSGEKYEEDNVAEGETKNTNKPVKRKKVKLRDEKKLKATRIAKLTEEANELKAIEAHIEEKLQFLVQQHSQLVNKHKQLIKARSDALSLDRQVAAQQLSIEIGVLGHDLESLAGETKELTRQSYFVSLERSRKRKLAKTLNAELQAELARVDLEKQIAADIKKMGVMKALQKFKKENGGLSPVKAVDLAGSGSLVEQDDFLPLIAQGDNDALEDQPIKSITYFDQENVDEAAQEEEELQENMFQESLFHGSAAGEVTPADVDEADVVDKSITFEVDADDASVNKPTTTTSEDLVTRKVAVAADAITPESVTNAGNHRRGSNQSTDSVSRALPLSTIEKQSSNENQQTAGVGTGRVITDEHGNPVFFVDVNPSISNSKSGSRRNSAGSADKYSAGFRLETSREDVAEEIVVVSQAAAENDTNSPLAQAVDAETAVLEALEDAFEHNQLLKEQDEEEDHLAAEEYANEMARLKHCGSFEEDGISEGGDNGEGDEDGDGDDGADGENEADEKLVQIPAGGDAPIGGSGDETEITPRSHHKKKHHHHHHVAEENTDDEIDKFRAAMRRKLNGFTEHNMDDGFQAFDGVATEEENEELMQALANANTSNQFSWEMNNDDRDNGGNGLGSDSVRSRSSSVSINDNTSNHTQQSKLISSHRIQKALENISNGVSDELEKGFNFVVETTSSKLLEQDMPIYVEEMVAEWENKSIHTPTTRHGRESYNSGSQQLLPQPSISEESLESEGLFGMEDSNDFQQQRDESEAAAGSGFSFAKLMKKVY